MDILIIEGVDYSKYIERKGYDWTRNDVDSEKSVRTKDTVMRRDKLGTKRKISYKLMNMTRDKLAALDDALSSTFYTATYLDLHGQMTKEFYTSSFHAILDEYAADEHDQWSGAEFTMIDK